MVIRPAARNDSNPPVKYAATWLNATASNWTLGTDANVSWPDCVKTFEAGSNLTKYIQTTPGSLACVRVFSAPL